MKLHRFIALILLLALGLSACQTGSKPGLSEDSATTGVTPGTSADDILTPTEEEIIRTFDHEIAEEWLEAAVLYERLSQTSVQPERSAFLIKTAKKILSKLYTSLVAGASHAGLFAQKGPGGADLTQFCSSKSSLLKLFHQLVGSGGGSFRSLSTCWGS